MCKRPILIAASFAALLPARLPAAEADLAVSRLRRTARSRALEDASLRLRGLDALGGNPARAVSLQPEFSTQYLSLLEGAQAVQAGLAIPWRAARAAFTIQAFRLSSPEIDVRDEHGLSSGLQKGEQRSVSMGAAREFAAGFAAGLEVRRTEDRTFADRPASQGWDAGVAYRLAGAPVAVGAAWSADGSSAGEEGRAVFSVSYEPSARLGVGAAYAARRDAGEASVGVEIAAGSGVSARGRYAVLSSARDGGVQSLSVGLGVRFFGDSAFDYAVQALDDGLGESGGARQQLTLTFRFGNGVTRNKGGHK